MSLVKNRKGMTLIEIMIVLAIIGGLMSLLGPRVLSQLDKSKARETNIIMGQIANALSMYYSDCAKYPESLEAITQDAADCSSWDPDPYKKLKTKDAWNREFVYEVNNGEFILKSLGKDGREGGSGVAKDLEYGAE